MYQDPSLYSSLSEDHQREAAGYLDRLLPMMNACRTSHVLDIGCGSGDVTYNVLMPRLSPTLCHLVGVDISNRSIDFARRLWTDERLSFQVLDISEPDAKRLTTAFPPNIVEDGFDQIFSFFCLQWVRDKRQMAANIRGLLRPGGQAMLLFVVWNGAYIVWDTIAQSETWKQYFTDVKLPLNEYVYMEEPCGALRETMEQAGLVVQYISLEEHKDAFTTKTEGDQEMISRLRSVDPIIQHVPPELHDDYLQDILRITKEKVSAKGCTDYRGVVIILTKPILHSGGQ